MKGLGHAWLLLGAFLGLNAIGWPSGARLAPATYLHGRWCIVKKQCGENMRKAPQCLHNYMAQ